MDLEGIASWLLKRIVRDGGAGGIHRLQIGFKRRLLFNKIRLYEVILCPRGVFPPLLSQPAGWQRQWVHQGSGSWAGLCVCVGTEARGVLAPVPALSAAVSGPGV